MIKPEIIIAIVLLTAVIGVILFYKLKEKYVNYADAIQHTDPIKKMLSHILNTFNKEHNTSYHLVDIDSYKTENISDDVKRFYTRSYVHNIRQNEGRQFFIVFTLQENNIKVEQISLSNAINLPITDTKNVANFSTRSGIHSTVSKDLQPSLEGIEQTDIDFHPYKQDGLCIRNMSDYYKMFNPSGFNDKNIKVDNEYAVSFTGLNPLDNPTVARQEKLDYEDPMSSLFRPGSFDGADGNIAN